MSEELTLVRSREPSRTS